MSASIENESVQLPATRMQLLAERSYRRLAGLACGSLMSVATDRPMAALTFDDGPHPEFTPQLLETLERYGARGTFFCVGEHAARHPEVIRRIAGAGHCVAHHTWNHASMPLLSRADRISQMNRCKQALSPWSVPLFRPPYGHQSVTSWWDARRLGYEIVGWTSAGEDWLDNSADLMAARIRRTLYNGGIVLLHDRLHHAPEPRYFDRGPMIEAVRILLDQLEGEIEFVTVPKLRNAGRPVRQPWFWKPDERWLNTLRDERGVGRACGPPNPAL